MEYYKITVPKNPALCNLALRLWTEIFGEKEARIDAVQLSGQERAQNVDMLYVAMQDGLMHGTCHLTIPKHFPAIGGLSGVCTSPGARGQGISRNLCAAAIRDFEAENGKVLFLGTENPAAARLYQSLGFSFLPGSNVMCRCSEGTIYDFYNTFYKPGRTALISGDCAFRIPIIPLILFRSSCYLMDCNANLFSSAAITQKSCMGLYPRYEKISQDGGAFCGIQNESGALCALASISPQGGRYQLDCFAHPDFEQLLPDLIYELDHQFGDIYVQIATCDTKKQELFQMLGYRQREYAQYVSDQILTSCTRWSK